MYVDKINVIKDEMKKMGEMVEEFMDDVECIEFKKVIDCFCEIEESEEKFEFWFKLEDEDDGLMFEDY